MFGVQSLELEDGLIPFSSVFFLLRLPLHWAVSQQIGLSDVTHAHERLNPDCFATPLRRQ